MVRPETPYRDLRVFHSTDGPPPAVEFLVAGDNGDGSANYRVRLNIAFRTDDTDVLDLSTVAQTAEKEGFVARQISAESGAKGDSLARVEVIHNNFTASYALTSLPDGQAVVVVGVIQTLGSFEQTYDGFALDREVDVSDLPACK